MLAQSLLVESPLAINEFYENCCGLAEFTLKLSPGEPNHVVTKIDWLENGLLDCGSSVVSFDGVPFTGGSLPYNITLTPYNEIKVVVSICECNGNPIQGNLRIQTQAGANHNFYYDLEPIACDISYLPTEINWYPCKNDCNELQPVSLSIENPLALSYEVRMNDTCDIIFGTNPPEYYLNGVLQPLAQFQIPPQQTSTIHWTFCPAITYPDSCSLTLDFCTCTTDIIVNVIPVTCNDCGVNCISAQLLTENNYIPATFDFCDNGVGQIYQYGAIGEKKILQLHFQYDFGFLADGAVIYFNPVLFDVICNFANLYGTSTIGSPPPAGWSYVFQTGDIGTTGIPMQLFGAGVNANSQKNISAYIDILNNYEFVINLEFYLIADIENWIDSNTLPNQKKLLKNHISAPTDLTNVVQSVYNINKQLCVLIYISDPNNLVAVPGTNPTQYTNFECYTTKSMSITARFYNQGLYASASEMTSPQFTLFRNATLVNNLSTILKTQVKFKVNYSGTLTNVLFWVIDGSQFDDSVTFVQNYDSSRGEITTNPLIGLIDNNLFSPSVAPTLIAPNTWECSAYVGINLNPSGQYYIIAVCYDSGTYIVNSFISSQYAVTQIPGNEICCPMDVTSFWYDYHNKYSGSCFSPTMKERLKNTLNVDSGDFGNCLKDYGWNPALIDWTTYLTDIKLNIYRKVDNFPIAGQSTYFMFDQLQSIRTPGYPNNFNNLSSNLICAESGLTFDVEWNGRVRYENNPLPGSQVFVSNNATPMNRIPAGALGNTYVSTNGINYDWADQDIYFEYVFRFDLSSLFPTTFIANLVYVNKIHPIDFETTPNPFPSLFKPLIIEGVKGTNPPVTITGQFCEGQFDYLIVTMQDNVTPDLVGEFIAFLDPYPYGIQNLQESDPIASPIGMIQLSSIPIYNVSNVFNGSAQFYVDLTSLPVGKYQLCGLYHV